MQLATFARIGFLALSTMAAGPALPQSSPAEGPPIVVMSLPEIEPPRNVPAAEWKSPYCAKWDDGCTECRRTSLDNDPICSPAADYVGGGVCQPRGVLCTTSLSNELARVCWRQGWASLSRPGVSGLPPMTLTLSGFSRDAKTGHWYEDSVALLPDENADRTAHEIMKIIGRDPDSEFGLTDQQFVATVLCMQARKEGGGGQGSSRQWLEMESKR